MTTEKPTTVHTPVMMAPMGKMRILVPGTTNGTLATMIAASDAVSTVMFLVWSENTPVTKVASVGERVVLMAWPEGVTPARVMIGMRIAWRSVELSFAESRFLLICPTNAYACC